MTDTSSHLLSWPPTILTPVKLSIWKRVNSVDPTWSLGRGKVTRPPFGRKPRSYAGMWGALCSLLDEKSYAHFNPQPQALRPRWLLVAAPVVCQLEEQHNGYTSSKYFLPEELRTSYLRRYVHLLSNGPIRALPGKFSQRTSTGVFLFVSPIFWYLSFKVSACSAQRQNSCGETVQPCDKRHAVWEAKQGI